MATSREDALARIQVLLEKPHYGEEDKAEIKALLIALGLGAGDVGTGAVLRQIRGRLVRRAPSGELEIVATGRVDWVGAVEPEE